MRVLLGILAVLLMGLNASAQKRITMGLDIAETIRNGNVRIMAGYGFHERWSVRYDTSIATFPLKGESRPEYDTHNGEFNTISEETESPALTTCISVQYWPARTFRGIYTEIGCRIEAREIPCCIVGIGYCMPIWKGLSTTLSYSTDIGPSPSSGKGCIAMAISWTFGNI